MLDSCNDYYSVVNRSKVEGFTIIIFYRLEPLFYKYGVDIIFTGHEHSYERMWPVYNLEVVQYNYINCKAPVHIITGTAGCNELDGKCFAPMLKPQGGSLCLLY